MGYPAVPPRCPSGGIPALQSTRLFPNGNSDQGRALPAKRSQQSGAEDVNHVGLLGSSQGYENPCLLMSRGGSGGASYPQRPFFSPGCPGSHRPPKSSTQALWRVRILLPKCESESRSFVSDSLQPHGLYSPWNSPGQTTRVGSLSLLPHCRRILYQLSHITP